MTDTLNKPEMIVMNMLNNEKTPEDIYDYMKGLFPGLSYLPAEYEQALKRSVNLYQERNRNIGRERKDSINWRDQYLAGKAKRH